MTWSSSGPASTVIGMPSERATIAACAVTPPPASAIPASCSPCSATSAGPRSSATRMNDEPLLVVSCVRRAGGDARGAPPQRAHVVGARRQERVRQRRDQGGVLLGRLDQRRGAGRPRSLTAADTADSSRGSAAMSAPVSTISASSSRPCSRSFPADPLELGRGPQQGLGARSASASASAWGDGIARGHLGGMAEDPRVPDRESGRRGRAAQDSLAHQVSCSTARWSAAMMSAAEVAPGSWCPIERSPRYEARPFRA